MGLNPYASMVYKVDWLALTIPDYKDQNVDDFELLLLENLGYDVAEFEEVPGRYFYNSGLTLDGYVNIYYNDRKKLVSRNSSMTRNYIWTGQGCTDLAQKIDSDWSRLFLVFNELGVKVTRIDLALDDYHAVVDFEEIETKLKQQEYRSSKRGYNIVKEVGDDGITKGHTIYIGSRSRSAEGCYYMRCYDKFAQYKSKAQLPPEEAVSTGKWQRYEISFTKKKAQKVVERIGLDGRNLGAVFKETARDVVEFLVPDENQKNKSRWKTVDWWEKFLDGAEKAKLGDPEKDVDLGRMLRWLRTSVVPALHMLQEVASAKEIDFFEILKSLEIEEYSKKQKRLKRKTEKMAKEDLQAYLELFKRGYR